MTELTAKMEEELDIYTQAEINHAPWMAQVLIALPKDPSYKKLSPSVREEIETILAAIE